MKWMWRVVAGRPRLAIAAVIGLLAYPLAPSGWAPLTRGVVAWDIGCLALLLLCAQMFSFERKSDMAQDAAAQQEGEWTIFALTVAVVAASFAAILGEFSALKADPSNHQGQRVALVAVTLLVSWLVTHTVFALRYAHEFYTVTEGFDVDGGLQFPDDTRPDYWDFFYFALVLGMTFQVSDVQITSKKLRRLATVHGLLGFMFNTVILALSINIAASFL